MSISKVLNMRYCKRVPTQGIGGAIISTLGTIVAIFALAIFIVWTIKEIAVKRPMVFKWILIVLFICIVVTFMPKFG